jgi:undecaprenyl-diphosphatase
MDANFLPILLGFVASIIAGYFAIKWMLDLIKNKSLDIFAYYCWIVGIVVFMGSIAHIF